MTLDMDLATIAEPAARQQFEDDFAGDMVTSSPPPPPPVRPPPRVAPTASGAAPMVGVLTPPGNRRRV